MLKKFFLSVHLYLYIFCSSLRANVGSEIKEAYSPEVIQFLHSLYGAGYLAEGGVEGSKLFIDYLNLNGAKILDFGCGSGGVAHFISETAESSYVVGIDIVPSCIQSAKERFPKDQYPKLDFVSYKSLPLPFASNTFDFVFAKEVFIHIFEKERTIKELYRILKPGGQIVIIDWFSQFKDVSHENQIIQPNNLKSFELFLNRAGFFEIVKYDYTDKYLCFLNETIMRIEKNPSVLEEKIGYRESLKNLTAAILSMELSVLKLHFMRAN